MNKKKIAAFLSAILAFSTLSINTFADTSNTITVPVRIDSESIGATVNGFIAEINYDADVLTPVIADEADILGEDCYAVSAVDVGYLTADKAEDGRLLVGWANKDFYSLEDNDNDVMAYITFEVDSGSENSTTTVDTKIYQVARYSDILLENEFEYSNEYDLPGTEDTTDDTVIADDTESGSSVVVDDVNETI